MLTLIYMFQAHSTDSRPWLLLLFMELYNQGSTTKALQTVNAHPD